MFLVGVHLASKTCKTLPKSTWLFQFHPNKTKLSFVESTFQKRTVICWVVQPVVPMKYTKCTRSAPLLMFLCGFIKPEIVHTWKPKKWEFDSFDAKASRTPKHSQANIGKLNEIDMFHHEHSNLTFDPTNMHPNPPFVVAPFRHGTIQEGQKLWDVGHGSEIGTQSWPPTASEWSWSHFHRIFLTWSFQIWLPGWVVNRMKLTTQL